MITVQTRALTRLDELSSTNIRRQHTFFNQTVRIVTSTRQNFLDLAIFVTDNIGLYRFELHRTTHFTRIKQHFK